MWETLGYVIANHFYEIFVMVIIVVVVAILAKTLESLSENKNSVQLAQLSIQSEKLDMFRRQALLRQLSDASVMLTDEEKERLDSVQEDLAVLSRRNISLMNEIEVRTSRLERGTELAMMKDQMQKITSHEKKLFGIK